MDKEEIQKREVYYHRYLITINNQKVFKRVMNYKRMRIIHYDSSLYLLLQSLFIKRRLILHTVV